MAAGPATASAARHRPSASSAPASGYLRDFGRFALVAVDRWFGGLRLSLAADGVHFESLKDPLIPIDGADWNRPAPTALIAYVSLINPDDGSNAVGSDFLLAYVYIPPEKTFADRYLVLQRVTIAMTAAPLANQAAIALTRWRNDGDGTSAVSSGPITDPGFRRERSLGYLLTSPPGDGEGAKLEECSGDRAGGPGTVLALDGSCAGLGLRRERTSGWAYAVATPGTVPLYSCVAGNAQFISNSADCEGTGRMQQRLGFALQR